jgi:hypothetical protein
LTLDTGDIQDWILENKNRFKSYEDVAGFLVSKFTKKDISFIKEQLLNEI